MKPAEARTVGCHATSGSGLRFIGFCYVLSLCVPGTH